MMAYARVRNRSLFTTGHQGDYPIRCRLCRKMFRRWNGTANHGLMHVDRGEATCESDPCCPPTSGHRYLFYVKEEKP